jgi:hypothetical protein
MSGMAISIFSNRERSVGDVHGKNRPLCHRKSHQSRGAMTPSGGLFLPQKYKFVIAPDDYPGRRYRKNTILEHHLNWWKVTGETVPAGMILHHKNEIKTDNRPENLQLMTLAEHTKEHSAVGRSFKDVICSYCGVSFQKEIRQIKLNQINFYCSRRHMAKSPRQTCSTLEHGNQSMYRKGCRCDICKNGNRLRHISYRSNK